MCRIRRERDQRQDEKEERKKKAEGNNRRDLEGWCWLEGGVEVGRRKSEGWMGADADDACF